MLRMRLDKLVECQQISEEKLNESPLGDSLGEMFGESMTQYETYQMICHIKYIHCLCLYG